MKSTWNLLDSWNPNEICQISWNLHEIHWISWNPPDFKIMSLWVITKYRSFFRKTKQQYLRLLSPQLTSHIHIVLQKLIMVYNFYKLDFFLSFCQFFVNQKWKCFFFFLEFLSRSGISYVLLNPRCWREAHVFHMYFLQVYWYSGHFIWVSPFCSYLPRWASEYSWIFTQNDYNYR